VPPDPSHQTVPSPHTLHTLANEFKISTKLAQNVVTKSQPLASERAKEAVEKKLAPLSSQPLASERANEAVEKTLVPLSTRQGYDPSSRTLTIGRWQVSGVPYDPAEDSPAIAQVNGEAAPGLMHKASPPSNEGVVMGLAAYPNDVLGKFERFVGTLRFTGYEGHIILGVRPNLSEREARYLQAMNVTYYASTAAPCVSPLTPHSEGGEVPPGAKGKASGGMGGGGTQFIRATCSEHYNHLVFEWARYEMALGWIKGCPECKGWMLVCDVKDTVFQRPPFEDLQRNPKAADAVGPVKPDLMLFEEAFPPPLGFDNNHWFAWGSVRNCFGQKHEHEMMASYRNKAVLCSGSTVGTREGLSRYLAAITRRYYEMTWLGPDCTPPMAVDQPVHNWLFYTSHGYAPPGNAAARAGKEFSELSFGGGTGDRAVAMPLGTGPVATVGRLCSMAEKQKLKLGELGKVNLTMHPDTGLFFNLDGRTAPVVHQYDRCWGIWDQPLRNYCVQAHQGLRTRVTDPAAIRNDREVCKGG